MTTWLLRGLGFGFAMIVLRLVQGAMINTWETRAGTISVILVAIYIVAAFVFGFFDGRADAKKQPDPDRRADLSMMWLLAGLVAGVLSGAVCWIISQFYKNIYTGGLINELTVFAAFTALLTFIAALVAITLARFLVDRKAPPVRKHDGGERQGDENTDTDVFAAVGSGRAKQADATTTPHGRDAVDYPDEDRPAR